MDDITQSHEYQRLARQIPEHLHALAEPIARKYGCGVELSVTVHTTDPEDCQWTVEFQTNSSRANGRTLDAAVVLASEGLPTAVQQVEQLRNQARELLRRAHDLEAALNLPT